METTNQTYHFFFLMFWVFGSSEATDMIFFWFLFIYTAPSFFHFDLFSFLGNVHQYSIRVA